MWPLALLVVLNVFPSLTQGQIPAALTDLRSDDRAIVGRGVSVLHRASSQDPLVLQDDAVQGALLDLLARDNRLIRANVVAVQQGQPPLLEPESLIDYYFDVLGMAGSLLDIEDIRPVFRSRLLSELVRSTYNPDSPFAGRLSREGGRIVPAIVELAQSEISPERWNAYSLIAMVLQAESTNVLAEPLSENARERLKMTALRGLSDPEAVGRRWAIGAVVAGRDTRAISMLEQAGGERSRLGRRKARNAATQFRAVAGGRSAQNPPGDQRANEVLSPT